LQISGECTVAGTHARRVRIAALILTAAAAAFAASNGPAAAQKSTDLIVQDIRGSYFLIKASLHDDPRVAWTGDVGAQDKSLSLRDCSSGSTRFAVKGPIRMALVDLAYVMLQANSVLTKNNFPPELWQPALQKAEAEGVVAIERRKSNEMSFEGLMDRFSNSLNQAVRSKNLRLPSVNAVPECGGPPNVYRIHTKPPLGQVEAISKFWYLVCQKQKLDADDPSKCNTWLAPIRHGERQNLGGIYKYRVRWTERSTPLSEFDADRYRNGDVITFE
jgi:hypothetical protein